MRQHGKPVRAQLIMIAEDSCEDWFVSLFCSVLFCSIVSCKKKAEGVRC